MGQPSSDSGQLERSRPLLAPEELRDSSDIMYQQNSFQTPLQLEKRLAQQDQRLTQLEELRHKCELELLGKLQLEEQLTGGIAALRKAIGKQLKRIEEAEREANQYTDEEVRLHAEEQARLEAQGEQFRRIEEVEARLLEAQQLAHLQAEEEARLASELETIESCAGDRESEQRSQLESEQRGHLRLADDRLDRLEAIRAQEETGLGKQAELEDQLNAGITALKKAAVKQQQRIDDAKSRLKIAESEAKKLASIQGGLEEKEKQLAETLEQLIAEIARSREAREKQTARVSELREELAESVAQTEKLIAEESRLRTESKVVAKATTDSISSNRATSDLLIEHEQTDEHGFEIERFGLYVDQSEKEIDVFDERNLETEPVVRKGFKEHGPTPDYYYPNDPNDKSVELIAQQKGIVSALNPLLAELNERLNHPDPNERILALTELAQLEEKEDAFDPIVRSFDDGAIEVRNAAVRSLYVLQPDCASSFTRALREGSIERRRRIGAALASSGLAAQAIENLAGESREKTYEAFSLLFLMAKAGEVKPLISAVENHSNFGVRLAIIKLLAFSDQSEVATMFRRLAVRGSLPAEIRSALMEAIHELSNQRAA